MATLALIRVVTLVLLLATAGCGHDVEPTSEYSRPEDIPLCCTSDPSDGCCGLVAFAFSEGIEVSWNSEGSIFTYIDGWLLYRAVSDSIPPDSSYQLLFSVPYTFSRFRDEAITDGFRYWYRLASISPAGVESVPSAAVQVRADFTPPAPPTGLRATVSPTQVLLEWNDAAESDLGHYNVFREPDFPPQVFPRAFEARYLDSFVDSDSTYRYWVTAVDQGLNESAPSETIEVILPVSSLRISR